MEFDEQEDQEEEMGIPEASQPPAPASYDSLGNSAKLGGEGTAASAAVGRKGTATAAVRYRECQKNHAVSFGGHAVDGCCEFMAAGEDGTLESVICAACNCHRNFHRKEIDGDTTTGGSYHHRPQPPPPPHLHHHNQFSAYYHHRGPPYPAGYLHHLATPPMAQHRPLALPPAAATSGGGFSREEDDMSNPSSSGGGGGGGGIAGSSKKRFRTKFTQEQKEKMLAFAEQVGWRIQKHDEAAVEQFCAEACVKRNVLKIWMHNNKNTLGKKP